MNGSLCPRFALRPFESRMRAFWPVPMSPKTPRRVTLVTTASTTSFTEGCSGSDFWRKPSNEIQSTLRLRLTSLCWRLYRALRRQLRSADHLPRRRLLNDVPQLIILAGILSRRVNPRDLRPKLARKGCLMHVVCSRARQLAPKPPRVVSFDDLVRQRFLCSMTLLRNSSLYSPQSKLATYKRIVDSPLSPSRRDPAATAGLHAGALSPPAGAPDQVCSWGPS